MSLTPVFELGLWNAWIFILLVLLPLPLVVLFRKGVFQKSDSIPASFYTIGIIGIIGTDTHFLK